MRKLRLLLVFSFLFLPTTVFSSSLEGSKEALKKQNEIADIEAISIIENGAELDFLKDIGLLVAIPQILKVNSKLEYSWRWVRPQVADFLKDLNFVFEKNFSKQFQINSAVRTVDYQRRLQRTNANAAPTSGDRASPHLRGMTIDITKKGMSQEEVKWMRKVLLSLEDSGLIDATEEWNQLCFHITVFGSYQGQILNSIGE